MFCAQCGTGIADGSAFCHNCGAQVVPTTTPPPGPRDRAGKEGRKLGLPVLAIAGGAAVAGLAGILVAVLFVTGVLDGDNGDGDGQAPLGGEPVTLPPGSTCALPESFRFTTQWQLEAPSLGALIEQNAFLSDLLFSALGRTSLSGGAAGTFEAPAHVELDVDIEEAAFDLNFLPQGLEIRVPGASPDFGDADESAVLFGQEICSDLIDGLVGLGMVATREEVDGISALHVRLDEAVMAGLASLLEQRGVLAEWGVFGPLGVGDDAFGGVNDKEIAKREGLAPTALSADIWLAEDGLWPVRIDAEGTWQVEELGGDVNLTLVFQTSDVVTGPRIERRETPTPTRTAAPAVEEPTVSNEDAIESLARRSIEALPAGEWPSLYDSFTSEFQQRCPRQEFVQAGEDAARQLGDSLRLLRFKRMDSLTFDGSSAQAVITGEIAGQGEYQIQAAFQKEGGDWKIAPVPDTQGCQAFLRDAVRSPAPALTVTLDAQDADGVDTGVALEPGEAVDIRQVGGQLVPLTQPPSPWQYWIIHNAAGSQVRVQEYAFPIWGAGRGYAPGWGELFPFAECGIAIFAVVAVFEDPKTAPCNSIRAFSSETLRVTNTTTQTQKLYLAFNDSTHYWVKENEIFLDDPGAGAILIDGYAANVGSVTFSITR